MTQENASARTAEVLEAHITHLENELRYVIHTNDTLKTQLVREKEDFERQLARMREDMLREVRRVEFDLKGACRTRDELRAVLAEKEREAEKTRVVQSPEQPVNMKASVVETRPAKEVQPVAPILIKTESPEPLPQKRPVLHDSGSQREDAEVQSKRQKTNSSVNKNVPAVPQTPSVNMAPPTATELRSHSNDKDDQQGSAESANSKQTEKSAAPKAVRFASPLAATPAVVAAPTLPSSLFALQQRVSGVTTFDVQLPNKASPIGVSRAFLMATYGVRGSMFVKIKPEKNTPRGRVRPMILPRPEFSPGLPSSPGAPGTILSNRADIFNCVPVSLWVKTAPEDGLWKYFGNYIFARSVQPVTADEACQLDAPTMNAWTQLLSKKKWDCYAELRVRIWLRKIGLGATDKLVARHTDLIRTGESPVDLAESDISEAFHSWEETLHVVTMRCVGYDYDFLTDVETRWVQWQSTASANP
ncbi:hypothetical protein DENSPDRAFT_844103 [Dentipellis sp. KUC8613]|nr:hypothetical protein DENSPDRAFT_844103 [Dentipellis sp. KUC8613]